jgi:uncharacterized protein DUF932
MNLSTTRTATFGSGSTVLQATGNEPLSLETIAQRTPSVFAEGAHESRSSRYTYISTREVLSGLWAEGFRPFEVRQGGTKDEARKGFTKHMVRLRHADAAPLLVGGSPMLTEIIAVNAHDGTSSWELFAGAFVCVCCNGLIAGEIVESVKIRHRGDVVRDVIEGAYRISAALPAVTESARAMTAIELARPEQLAFARAAAELRWEPKPATEAEPAHQTAPIDPEVLLRPRRSADSGPDLWHTMNRVQEGLIQGGQRYNQTDDQGNLIARRRVRPVRSIDADRQLNRALWTLAEEMKKLKAA